LVIIYRASEEIKVKMVEEGLLVIPYLAPLPLLAMKV
jgi:hypothetical protein